MVGGATDGPSAVTATRRTRPDVVLMDIRMPNIDGLTATTRVLALPEPPRVLVLTTFDRNEWVYEALRAGASGFLLKDAEPDTLLAGIRTTTAGDAVISPRATKRIVDKLSSSSAEADVPLSPADRLALDELTERETEILVAIGRGWSNAEIAERMFISMPTVKTHVGRIFAKLGVENRVQVAILVHDAQA